MSMNFLDLEAVLKRLLLLENIKHRRLIKGDSRGIEKIVGLQLKLKSKIANRSFYGKESEKQEAGRTLRELKSKYIENKTLLYEVKSISDTFFESGQHKKNRYYTLRKNKKSDGRSFMRRAIVT